MKESNILFERYPYWVSAATTFKGFEVWRTVSTHSKRVASIGYIGEVGLQKAKDEIDRRIRMDQYK